MIRRQVLSLRTRGYVEAARVLGSSDLKIIVRHIAPNVLPLSFLYGSIAIGWAILTEASVSFLGFGDPDSISWGYMLQDAFASQALARQAYYWFVPPGVAIILVVLAGFFITRGYENILFPKLEPMTRAARRSATSRSRYRSPAAPMQAVDGACFDVPQGRHRRAGRRIRLRQDHGRARHHPGHRRQCRASPAARSLFDGRDLVTLSEREMRRAALARHRLHSAVAR